MFDSVRARLTLWHVGVLALVMLLFSVGIYVLLARNLHRRTDATIAAALAAMEHLLAYERAEGDSELEAARNTVAELRYPQTALAVYVADGRLLAETRFGAMQAALPMTANAVNETPRYFTLKTTHDPSEDEQRVAVQRVNPAANSPANLIVVAHSLEQSNEELEALRQVFMLAVPLALALVGLSGWFLTRKSLAPLAAIATQAEQIGAANLSERLLVANARDELGRVALTFNQLLARLEQAFAQQQQFMADASHELRTPLHIIRSAAEIHLQSVNGTARTPHEYQEALTMVNEQAMRLTHIVEDMFTLARADAGQRVLEPVDFYLDELVLTTARAAALLAVTKGVTVTVAPALEAPLHGDENLLRQMLLNLLDNAVKHMPAGGTVSVKLAPATAAYEIIVADTGAGIPAEAQPHIFERFYRADEARTRTGSVHSEGNGAGAGLGLAIARWVAEAHGGTLQLRQSDARGSVFVIRLPHAEK